MRSSTVIYQNTSFPFRHHLRSEICPSSPDMRQGSQYARPERRRAVLYSTRTFHRLNYYVTVNHHVGMRCRPIHQEHDFATLRHAGRHVVMHIIFCAPHHTDQTSHEVIPVVHKLASRLFFSFESRIELRTPQRSSAMQVALPQILFIPGRLV